MDRVLPFGKYLGVFFMVFFPCQVCFVLIVVIGQCCRVGGIFHYTIGQLDTFSKENVT